MNLSVNTFKWVLKHIKKDKDTDLFPKLKEYEILFSNEADLINELSKIDIGNYTWQPYRRFIIPKDEFSYRVAMQLDPIDSILFEAIIYEYGMNIENKRIPINENKVFNYRFKPDDTGALYNKKDSWKNFWNISKSKVDGYKYAVYIDIDDFYNRIYHHTLENQMMECCFPNQIIKAIKKLLQNTTQTVSQGIPIGPHASHILAEMCLIPIDDGLKLKGYNFCRYSDDIIIFAKDETDAKLIIYEMAKMLDSLKLTMQRHKTKIFTCEEFKEHCDKMLDDDPINDLEKNMILTMNKYTTNPYEMINYLKLEESDKLVFSEDNIKEILNNYLCEKPDYQRIRWLYKRLAKIGTNTILDYTIDNIDKLMPAINDIALYFISIANASDVLLHETGNKLIKLLDNDIIKSNEFFQITILSLFENTEKFNNISVLIGRFLGTSDNIKREIILAAFIAKATPWIRDIKQEYNNLGIWSKRAFLIASTLLPKDERKFFIQSVSNGISNMTLSLLEKYIKD